MVSFLYYKEEWHGRKTFIGYKKSKSHLWSQPSKVLKIFQKQETIKGNKDFQTNIGLQYSLLKTLERTCSIWVKS